MNRINSTNDDKELLSKYLDNTYHQNKKRQAFIRIPIFRNSRAITMNDNDITFTLFREYETEKYTSYKVSEGKLVWVSAMDGSRTECPYKLPDLLFRGETEYDEFELNFLAEMQVENYVGLFKDEERNKENLVSQFNNYVMSYLGMLSMILSSQAGVYSLMSKFSKSHREYTSRTDMFSSMVISGNIPIWISKNDIFEDNRLKVEARIVEEIRKITKESEYSDLPREPLITTLDMLLSSDNYIKVPLYINYRSYNMGNGPYWKFMLPYAYILEKKFNNKDSLLDILTL